LFLVLACFWACTTRRNPQTAYDHAQSTFQHGDLRRAQEEAKKGYDMASGLGTVDGFAFAHALAAG